MAESSIVARVRDLVAPIAADLGLDLYDCELAGGTLRIMLDTPAGSPGGLDLDTLTLASRLISRELDHQDPVPGHYTLEVTTPGLERPLRRPDHYRREVGKDVALRLRPGAGPDRRLRGTLVAADDAGITIRVEEPAADAERAVAYDDIERARTVFEWGPAPKPGSGRRGAARRTRPTPASTTEAPAS